MGDATIIGDTGSKDGGGGEDGAAGHFTDPLLNDPEFQCKFGDKLSLLFGGSSVLGGEAHNGSSLAHHEADMLFPQVHSNGLPTAEGERLSNFTFCPTEWDNLLCWPETVEGQMAILSCFSELNGIHYDVTRKSNKQKHNKAIKNLLTFLHPFYLVDA